MGNPLVSVIIPAYNHERYILQCVKSVLAQTYSNWEIIIVDDCSTDGTGTVIGEIRDKRISYIRHNTNYGKARLAESHNEALKKASGEFVTVLEGDDYWPEDRLATQLKTFDDPAVVLVHGAIALERAGNFMLWKQERDFEEGILNNRPKGNALKAFLAGMNPVFAQSAMVSRSALQRIGGFKQIPSLYLTDFPTWMELALHGEFAYIPKVLGYWRKHPASLTSIYQKELWLGIIDFIGIFIKDKREEIGHFFVNLDLWLKYPGAFAYSALYKLSLLQSKKRDSRRFLREVWKKRRALSGKEFLKILLLSPIAFIPLSEKICKKYVEFRTFMREETLPLKEKRF